MTHDFEMNANAVRACKNFTEIVQGRARSMEAMLQGFSASISGGTEVQAHSQQAVARVTDPNQSRGRE